jgi:hypothetical protein
MAVVPHSPYFSLFPRLKMKLKGCHFGTIEVMYVESHPHRARLPVCFLKIAKALGTVHMYGRGLLRG